jgi:hypothetical protein
MSLDADDLTPVEETAFLLCCNAFEEPVEHASYEEAVAALKAYVALLEADGWAVEHGWASRDNLLAARATKAVDSVEPNAVRFVQIVRDDQ